MVGTYLKYCILFCGIASAPALAQTGSADAGQAEIILAEPIRDSYITVVAAGERQSLGGVAQPVAAIDQDEIARVQAGADIARLLERLPGVTLTRNGGPGALTALRVRGGEAEQVLVLLDGVPVADPAAPAGGFDFGTLSPAGIGKIELLRGSNSIIWGSEAMAGVLAVTTQRRDGGMASIEYGGPQSVVAQVAAGHQWGALRWSADGAWQDSAGYSAAASGSEPDGYRQWLAGGRIEATLSPALDLHLALRHLRARLNTDGYPPPDYVLADTAEYQDTRRTTGQAGFAYRTTALSLAGNYLYAETNRANYDPAQGTAPTYTTHGLDQRVELRGHLRLADAFALRFGGEYRWARFATLYDAAREATSRGAYAQLEYAGDAVVLHAGLRRDEHAGFGGAWSLGGDGLVRLGNGWKLRASYGEGFKAPTLFQLYSDYGNAALRPERSRSFDLGIELGDRNGSEQLALSLFRRESSDLIGFVSCYGETGGICTARPYGTYDNVGRARAEGIELEAAYYLTDRLRARGSWSWVIARDRTPGGANAGHDLARRPRHAVDLSLDWDSGLFGNWQSDGGLALGADLRVVSNSFDDPASAVPLGGYAVATIRASLSLSDRLSLYGRIENVGDVRYETAAGYASPGRGAYFGVRGEW